MKTPVFAAVLLFGVIFKGYSQGFLHSESMNPKIDSAILFLKNTQYKSNLEGQYYRGEWPVDMNLSSWYFFLGENQKVNDSNAFSVSSIHNFLSEIYLLDSSKKQLLPLITEAYISVLPYQKDLKYYFWKEFESGKSKKSKSSDKDLSFKTRRPTLFNLNTNLVKKMANVPPDADDTAMANLSTYYQNVIFRKNDSIVSFMVFDQFRDLDRRNQNWFNLVFHGDVNSGAYLTWLYPEFEYGQYNVIKSALSFFTLFLPISTSYPKKNKPWVPFGSNDIDVVVNANILTYLFKSEQNTFAAKSVSDAVLMINNRLKKGEAYDLSVYYSNRYHIHYAVLKAFNNGAKELKPACDILLDHLLKSQSPEGYFQSRSYINNFDRVQSTANALYALLILKKNGFSVPKEKIDLSLSYLLDHTERSDKGLYWKGGVFFSGGSVLKNILFWQSDAYTTSLIALNMVLYQNLFLGNH